MRKEGSAVGVPRQAQRRRSASTLGSGVVGWGAGVVTMSLAMRRGWRGGGHVVTTTRGGADVMCVPGSDILGGTSSDLQWELGTDL